MKYIYHHLGLGDHIICNGLVRKFSSDYNNISLFCKPHNKESVEFMYRDLDNINIISLPSDLDVINYLQNNNISDIITVGFNDMYYTNSVSFDVSFYNQFEIDFESRWSNFRVDRDDKRESIIFNHFNLDNDSKYIFIHDDNRFQVDMNRISLEGLKIIRPIRELTDNIFDYLKVIENAKEVHTIESSFLFIIDSLDLNKEVYAHRYSRILGYMETPVYKNVKKIIN